MTYKDFLKGISNPLNWFYVFQSKIRQLITPIPDKAILDKVANCPICYRLGECQRCGCDFEDVIASDKKCEKFKNGDMVLIEDSDGNLFIEHVGVGILSTPFDIVYPIKSKTVIKYADRNE